MDGKFQEEARRLAARGYSEQAAKDVTTDGQPIYFISNPELPGCVAQGFTLPEARTNLQDAREDYIQSLLEDSLPVPDPAPVAATLAADDTTPISSSQSVAGAASVNGVVAGTPVAESAKRRQALYSISGRASSAAL